MGDTSWDEELYKHRATSRAATGTPTFHHDHAVRTGVTTNAIHDKLNPKGVKVRESRDSDVHPDSVPIAVLFDVTGSMGGVPKVFQTKLPKLMDILLTKGYCKDPQILIGAIGDHFSDRAPLQVGQFESGVEMDEDIGRIFIEGEGGGQNHESYQLGMYFMARHTVTDAWEKRGKKGYCNTPDAPVWMADQTFKPIGEIKSGDKVMGWERLNGRRSLVVTIVEAVQRRLAENVVQVTMESGRVLKCTDDHQWLSGHHGKTTDETSGWDIFTTVANSYGKGALLSHVIDPIPAMSSEFREDAAFRTGDRVTKIEPLPPQEVVSMQTTTHNYVAWGYASSNCFISGDELAYARVTRAEVKKWLGSDIEQDIPLADLVRELKERWNVFFLIPSGTSHAEDPDLRAFWANLIGPESVIRLPDPSAVSEVIGATVGMFESAVSLDQVAIDTSHGVRDALAPLAHSSIVSSAKGTLPTTVKGGGTVRL